jgi:hypothetical protein
MYAIEKQFSLRKEQVNTIMDSDCDSVVEHLPHHPEVVGSSPGTAVVAERELAERSKCDQ